MFQLEMESMSDIASTKAREGMNITEFQITFSVLLTLLLFKWQQERHMVLVLFFHNSLFTQFHLGGLF